MICMQKGGGRLLSLEFVKNSVLVLAFAVCCLPFSFDYSGSKKSKSYNHFITEKKATPVPWRIGS